MKRVVIASSIWTMFVFLLIGCASAPTKYPTMTKAIDEETQKKDHADCADISTQTYSLDRSLSWFSGREVEQRAIDMYQDCMQSRGYKKSDAPPALVDAPKSTNTAAPVAAPQPTKAK